MSPAMKVRVFYGLMILFVSAIIVQMGVFIAHQFRHGVHAVTMTDVLADLVMAYTLGRVIRRCSRQWRLSRKWIGQFEALKHNRLTKRLNYKYRGWGTELIVVRSEAFVALTIGMLRPKIVVSTAVFEMFADKEVEAILLHERHHCLRYDNLKLFLSTLLVDGFRYLPIVKPILTYYRTWLELFADRYVMRQMGTALYLGQVLLTMSRQGAARRYETAVHFEEAALHYRMMQVLEPDRPVGVPIALLRPFLASCSILLLLVLSGDGI